MVLRVVGDTKDKALLARLRDLQNKPPRPAPRKGKAFHFFGLKIPCPDSYEVPSDITSWIELNFLVHLKKCIAHYSLENKIQVDLETALETFLVHMYQCTGTNGKARYQRYVAGPRTYGFFFMRCFTNWITENYPIEQAEVEQAEDSGDPDIIIL